jgi:hypothetical protein
MSNHVRIGRRIASRFCLGVLLACFFAASAVLAQNTNAGEIRGAVTDASGSVMPGVRVVLLNADTGVAKEIMTNDAGLYDAVSILPGNYTLTFMKEGFDKLVRSGVVLNIGFISVDARMTVGAASQVVQVTAEASLLKTETGVQSTSLQVETMAQLPNVGETWTNFTKLLPGTAGSGTSLAVNGNMRYEDNWLADGGQITNPHSSNVDIGIFENVAEVQISTSSFDAQYGIGGAVLNQISKSGTNRFHGSAYEYLENTFFNARSFFAPIVPVLHRNNFGGAVGGPIKKDKVFFYFNYDRLINNSTTTPFYTYPTAAMKAGDFSNTSIFPMVYDPASLANGVRQPFSNNRIPASRIDPVAANIQAFYPTPNLPGVVNNWLGSLTATSKSPRYFGRLDYNISNANRLSFTIINMGTASYTPTPDCPADCYSGGSSVFQSQITDVWTLSPSTINEFRFAFQREYDYDTSVNYGQNFPQKLGIQYAVANVFPDVTIGGSVPVSSLGVGTNAILGQNSFIPSDIVTLIRGRHIIKFGGELQALQDNTNPWGNYHSASFTFGSVFTQSAPFNGKSGLGYADFLTGSVDAWSASNLPVTGVREKSPQFFVQDDYKVLPGLTLNVGLRYEIQSGWSEVAKRIGLFDPALTNPATNTPGAIWFQGTGGRNSIQAPIHDLFLPRVGFAWSPWSKWAVRGGFGIYDYLWSTDTYANNGHGVGFGSGTRGSEANTDQIQPLFQLSSSNPPLNTVVASPATNTPQAYNGQNIYYYPYHTPVAHSYEWSLSIQRELRGGIVVEGAYVGNRGTSLSNPTDLNQVPPNLLGKGAPQSNRPFPQFLSINADVYTAISNYDSMQLSLKKRFSRGMSFDLNYTWSKFLDVQDSSGWGGQAGSLYWQNAYNLAAGYGLSNNDIPKMLKGDMVYQLPVGKGKTYLDRGGVVNALLGGWQASAIFIAESGTPFTPIMGTQNQTGALAGTWFSNVVGNPSLPNRSNHEWFNVAAFAQPASFTYGNAGRNILRGPDMTDIDFSMAKSLPIPKLEGGSLQLRFDATNIINHPSFSNPNNNIGTPSAGIITGTTVGGRVLQLGARLSF